MKTAKLTGVLLDLWVARAEGIKRIRVQPDMSIKKCELELEDGTVRYSSDWDHGGPIIEREGIGLEQLDIYVAPDKWHAEIVHIARPDGVQRSSAVGPTALTAAMRAYVISKWGDDVPD